MSGQQYHGRLELTWTNKDMRLLAHENGSYEWLPPSDFRVAEVRLLHDVTTVGEVAQPADRAHDNLLIRGDALNALTSLATLPEFEREYAGKVKLAYLDPPFNTQQSFLQYDDALEHSVWLTMMRDRLVQVKQLLSPVGSVYVHCDASEGHYLKILLDEVFGRSHFRSEVVWKRSTAHSDTRQGRKEYGAIHDTIQFYTAGDEWAWNTQYTPYDDQYIRSHYGQKEPGTGRRYYLGDLTAAKAGGDTNYDWRGVRPYPGRYWAYSRANMERFEQEGRLVYGPSGMPRYKRYLDEMPGVPLQDLWVDINPVNSQAREAVPFATQKPEALLQRIIATSSNPGDIILDCFLGSGTTAAVAHKMGRRWVGIERSRETLETYTVPRLTRVATGEDPGGITKEIRWQGGGGFRVLEVAPSMFEDVAGQIFLSGWATNRRLAEATAAQLRYNFAFEPPFCGRRGRSRLAVVDGLVNEGVVRLLVRALGEDELLVLCGTAVDPAAGVLLRDLRPGSTVRKIPQSILQEYRQAVRWVQPELFGDGEAAESLTPAGSTDV